MTFDKYKYMIYILAISLILFGIIFILIPEFSGFLAIFIKASFGIVGFYFMDKFFLKGVDTVDEIKKGNMAVPIIHLAYALIYASAIVSV